MLVTELIDRGARAFAQRPAVLFGDERLTFAGVDAASARLARLLSRSLAPGEPVGLLLGNGLMSVPLDFACARARLVRAPLNPRLSAAEQERMLAGLSVRVLIHDAPQAERARALREADRGLTLLSLEDDLIACLADISDGGPAFRAEPEDAVLALYTSGTTGVLKAAVHTQATFGAIAANILLNLIDPRPGDVMLHAASLIHASGTFVLPYWIRGGAAAVLPGFEPTSYLQAVERHGATALNLVPTMIGMLLERPETRETNFSRVRDLIYGASPMPRPVMERALELWGPKLSQYYGQTEAPLCIAVLRKEDHVGEGAEARWSACGRPSVDCEVRLLDEAGAEVAPGEAGEIVLRAPFVMRGYHQAPELNAQTFTPDGWLRTRDVGRFDEAGYLHLVDRASDMIVTGGYNVYPREVEDVLAAHPQIAEAVVVGAPDDRWGEAVTAFVVLRSGELDAEAVIAFARERLAGYKLPKAVHAVAEMPKSPVGKPLRRAVRDPLWAGRERRI